MRVIGPGRAGTALALAVTRVGWAVDGPLGRGDHLSEAAAGVDLLVVATPDAVIESVAAAVRAVPTTVVAHLSGAVGLGALAPHQHRAAIHPLVPLPDPERGAGRLTSGCWFAVAGHGLAHALVHDLGGRSIAVADGDRAAYHAAACMAANHLVALMGQVERVAESAGVPLAPYIDLARAALDDVAEMGPRRALTGPAARGDVATLRRHLAALASGEHPTYQALAREAQLLAGRSPEELLR